MKKILLLITIIPSTLTGYSQTEKGKKMIGGQISFGGSQYSRIDSSTMAKATIQSFNINPKFGYFIKDNFAVGGNVDFGLSHYVGNIIDPNYTSTFKSKSISFGAGVFARYYKKINDNFSFFLNGNLLYSHSPYSRYERTTNSITNVFNTERIFHTISIAISPGLVYFPSPKLGIEASFGNIFYNYSTYKDINVSYKNHDNLSNYGINVSSMTFNLGMNYYF